MQLLSNYVKTQTVRIMRTLAKNNMWGQGFSRYVGRENQLLLVLTSAHYADDNEILKEKINKLFPEFIVVDIERKEFDLNLKAIQEVWIALRLKETQDT